MFGLSTLNCRLAISFLIFGGGKLPEPGAGLGKGITSFKKSLRDLDESGKS